VDILIAFAASVCFQFWSGACRFSRRALRINLAAASSFSSQATQNASPQARFHTRRELCRRRKLDNSSSSTL
jgi:hypothetical protein